jgi:hypothetical protein
MVVYSRKKYGDINYFTSEALGSVVTVIRLIGQHSKTGNLKNENRFILGHSK